MKNIRFPNKFNRQCVRIPNTTVFLPEIRQVPENHNINVYEGRHGTKNLLIQAIILCYPNFPECFLESVEVNLLNVFFSLMSSSYAQRYSSITLRGHLQIHIDWDRRVGLNPADGLRQSDFLAIKITMTESRIATPVTTINDVPMFFQRLKSRKKTSN